MCRSIKVLRRTSSAEEASPAEVEAAALQFVRKVSGFQKPSRRNEEAFNAAVQEIRDASQRLLESLETPAVKSA